MNYIKITKILRFFLLVFQFITNAIVKIDERLDYVDIIPINYQILYFKVMLRSVLNFDTLFVHSQRFSCSEKKQKNIMPENKFKLKI